MIKKILISLLLICGWCAASASTPPTAVDSITRNYNDWTTVSLQGKVRMSGIPVRATAKIYMERNRTILISLSAPFIGEAGRIEVQGNSVTLINKMKGVYAQGDLNSLLQGIPVNISDVQDLLLGRVCLIGYGTLSNKNSALSEITDAEKTWIVVPLEDPTDFGATYGYIVNKDLESGAFLATDNSSFEAQIEYEFSKNGKYDAEVSINSPKMNISADFEMEDPKWGVKSLSPAKLNSNLKKVGFRELLKSF